MWSGGCTRLLPARIGWSRAATVTQVRALYVADGLLPRGLNEPMLCRWEHDSGERPDREYTVMLCRTYGAAPAQLGLGFPEHLGSGSKLSAVIRYGRPQTARAALAHGKWWCT